MDWAFVVLFVISGSGSAVDATQIGPYPSVESCAEAAEVFPSNISLKWGRTSQVLAYCVPRPHPTED
jgi:hypothetical protein